MTETPPPDPLPRRGRGPGASLGGQRSLALPWQGRRPDGAPAGARERGLRAAGWTGPLLVALLACGHAKRPPEGAGDDAGPLGAGFDAGPGFVTASGGHLVDDKDGEILLRGFDLSGRDKTPPYFPGLDLPDGGFVEWSPAGVAPLLSYGLNTVRFLISWEALEPQRGVFDEAYLDHVVAWVQGLSAQGFWVIVDMHQDLYSSAFDGIGNGCPAWTCPAENYRAFDATYDGGAWFAQYATPPITACFDHLWHDGDGVQEDFAAAWARVAARLSGEPRVLGYDLLNEPWAGSANAGDGTFGAELLQPFYEKLMAAIRAVDHNHLFFLEPAAWTVDTLSPSGMRFSRGDVVYFPHYYDMGEQITGRYSGAATTAAAFQYFAREAGDIGHLPWALGEFGTTIGNPEYGEEISDVLQQVDALSGGLCWWDENVDRATGTGDPTLIAMDGGEDCSGGLCPLDFLARPRPLRVAGTLESFAWDAGAGTASLSFTASDAAGTTDVALPGAAWAGGPRVESGDPAGWAGSWDAVRSVYHYTASGPGPHTLVLRRPR